MSYHDRHPKDNFILLVIVIFGCLHQHADNFFHQYVNVAWSMKGFGRPLLILCSIYKQIMFVVLHRVHIATILQCVVAIIRKVSSRLGVLPSFLLISLHDLLHVISMMGLGPRLLDFFSEGSPLCILCFQVLSFVWTSILSFFFSCSLVRCFSYVLIYHARFAAMN
jgi:hypothetical protein